MIWQWWWFFASFAAVFACLAAAYLADDGAYFALAIAFGVSAFLGLMCASIIGLERHYGRVACRTFAAQTSRPTKFVIYTSWDGGDCLTPDGHNRWIPTKNLREFGS